ncbi:MAG: repair protein RadC [Rickettsiaceae bacterium]|jgi:DNA repair protein RadC|nr:repair protein RadC [Rickettsiaceae bacterium]
MKPEKENSPHYLGHRKRVKSKFLKNSGNFADYELLELLLFSGHARKDVKPLAKKLLAEFGSIENLLNADAQNLKSFKEVNENVLVSFKLVKEIITRTAKQKISNQPIISNWKGLSDYCQITMANLKEEQFRVLFLDKKHHLIADELEKNGNIEEVEIDLRDIVKKSLNFSAKSVILLHNHPGGDVNPSKADIANTNKILLALKTIGVEVYDHLIIGKNGTIFSFKSEGLL